MNELTYVYNGEFSYWSHHDYYQVILPRMFESMTDDEKF